MSRRLVAALSALAMTVVMAAPASAQAAIPTPPGPGDPQRSDAVPTDQRRPSTIDPSRRDSLLPQGWRASTDLAWTTSGDASGFHVLVAPARDGYSWRTVATLAEPGFDVDQWIGNACVTGSGRRLVVVYAPRTFTNKAELFDRGGFTAVVDLTTGAVRKLPVMGSLAYFNPGCGTDERAVVSQFRNDTDSEATGSAGGAATRLVVVDAAKASAGRPVAVRGEVTSAVHTRDGIVAAAGDRIVRIDRSGTPVRLAHTTGVPFRLAADGNGGLVYMDHLGDRVRVQRSTGAVGTAPVTLAEGGLNAVGVTRGAGGRVFITGEPTRAHQLPTSVRRLPVARHAEVSTTGQLALTRVGWARLPDGQGATPDGPRARAVGIDARVPSTGSTVTFTVDPDRAGLASGTQPAHPKLSASGDAPEAAGSRTAATPSPTDPVDADAWCGVPRNDARNQALQPKPRQIEWAVDQAVTGSLTGTREADWKNSGLPGYSPQALFPPLDLAGGGRVPAQILLGIAAQESNLWQASRVALPGVMANPLIGNFYGREIYNDTEADDWDIHWNQADCGYGVMQVTDGMRKAGYEKPNETAMGEFTQRVVALDFTVNIAAGLRILQEKWNQTRAAGLMVNNGRPESLENWFFALWAYNSGFYPDKGNGTPWGVGWGNNPANPRYNPQRQPFLEYTYDDARHPQDWPYPEKVLGWAGHPIESLEAPDTLVAGFRAAWWTGPDHRKTVRPPLNLFCDDSNDCRPGQKFTPNVPDDPSIPGDDEETVGEPAGPCAHTNNAGQYDLKCWYHRPVTWKSCPETCGYELLRFDPGYAYQTDGTSYRPRCTLTGLPENALIIDDLKDTVQPMRDADVNTECVRRHTNAGTFSLDFADDAGSYVSKVDFHQIGGGFNGHFWFAHTRQPGFQDDRFRVTGTWTLDQQVTGWARVMVFVPDQGAHTQQAAYTVHTRNGPRKRVILQRTLEHRWVSLGVFEFANTPKVELTSVTRDGDGSEDVAFDAVAFQRLPGKPANQVVALGDSYSSGEGASADGGVDYYRETDNNGANEYQNACHRSRYAWSRKAKLPDATAQIGARADTWDSGMDYHLLACSGAESENIIPFHSVPDGVTPPRNADNEAGVGKYRELSQLDRGFLDENTTLVTLSIGGNDARFADVISECVLFAGLLACPDAKLSGDDDNVDVATRRRINGPVKQSVKIVLDQIHQRAPNAKILLMGYPVLLNEDFSCAVGIGTEEAPWLERMALLMRDRLTEAAAETNAALGGGRQFVWFSDPIDNFTSKEICGDPESIHFLVAGTNRTPGERPSSVNPSQQSFHPNLNGATLYADSMNQTVSQM